jgi:peroxiredoxin
VSARTTAAIVVCALVGAGAGFLVGSRVLATRPAPEPGAIEIAEIGSALPAVSLPDLGGKQRGLHEWRGRPMVLNFFATWCEPCVREMPLLQEAAEDRAARAAVIGIAQDDPDAVRDFVARLSVRYPVLLDLPASGLSLQLGDRRGVLPYTVLVDANGTIRATRAGNFPDRATLDRWLEQSLAD